MSSKWPKLCKIPCRRIPQTDSPEDTPRNMPVPSGYCPESGRLLESARSARFSEIYGMSARSVKSLNIVLEDDTSTINTDDTSTINEDDTSTINEDATDQSNIKHSMISISEKQCDDSSDMYLTTELINDIINDLVERAYQDTQPEILDTDEGDESEVTIPKLRLDRLMSARSNYSIISRKTLASGKSKTSIGKGWDWKYLIPGYPWMGSYWAIDHENSDKISMCSTWSNCS